MYYTAQTEYHEHTSDTIIIHYDTLDQPVFSLETEDPAVAKDFLDSEGETDFGAGWSLIFNDRTFENREYTFVFTENNFIRRQYEKVLSVHVALVSLSKDYYYYTTTLKLQNRTDGDPFAEPLNVHNNIQNGFGIFGGLSKDMKRVDF